MGIFKRRKEAAPGGKHPFTAAVIVAAGRAERMRGRDKILEELGGCPVIARSIWAFDASPLIDEIVLVTSEERIPLLGKLCTEFGFGKVSCVVKGGASRAESVFQGLGHISREAELVAVHDGARPLVTAEVIEATARLAAKTGAAIPAVPVKDTVKRAAGGVVRETPPRAELFAAQTPQIFNAALLKAALTRALETGEEVTDDASAVEKLGMAVRLAPGSEENIKITVPEDLALAAAILERRVAPCE